MWFDESTENWVSYFLVCHHDILNSNQQSGENNTKNEINDGRIYLIGAIVMVLVFIGGIFGGYIVYKRECCCKNKNKNECSQIY